jgi:hypothetical protein
LHEQVAVGPLAIAGRWEFTVIGNAITIFSDPSLDTWATVSAT